MDINGLGALTGPNSANLVTTQTATDKTGAAPAPATPGVSQFTPTADLTALLKSVQQVPQVRQELIGDVARRLNSGELFIPPTPDAVVGGLLGSGALGDL
jgi:hypothetical protein